MKPARNLNPGSEVAQQVKGASFNLSSMPRTHIVERENPLVPLSVLPQQKVVASRKRKIKKVRQRAENPAWQNTYPSLDSVQVGKVSWGSVSRVYDDNSRGQVHTLLYPQHLKSVSVNEGVKFNNWKTKENPNEPEVINPWKPPLGLGKGPSR